MTIGNAALLLPLRYGYFSALSYFAKNLKLVNESFGALKPRPVSTAGRIADLHGQFEIRNARSLVLECQPQTPTRSVLHDLDCQASAPTMLQGVVGQLARCRDDAGLVNSCWTSASLLKATSVLSHSGREVRDRITKRWESFMKKYC